MAYIRNDHKIKRTFHLYLRRRRRRPPKPKEPLA